MPCPRMAALMDLHGGMRGSVVLLDHDPSFDPAAEGGQRKMDVELFE